MSTAAKPRLKKMMSKSPNPTQPRLIAESSITSAVGHGTIPPAKPQGDEANLANAARWKVLMPLNMFMGFVVTPRLDDGIVRIGSGDVVSLPTIEFVPVLC